jgi:hypothetical protein
VKLKYALLGFVAVAGLMWAEDVDDSYAALQEAVKNKDVEQVKKLAPATAKLANELAAKPQPSDASLVENWKGRVEFGKQVSSYAEYALSSTAAGASDPAQTIALVEALIEVNPKSTYLTSATPYYLQALSKNGGAAKQLAGAEKLIKGNPNNEDALYALASGRMNQSYATRLVQVMKTKAKPEGVSDADWDKKKSMFLGQGYYIAGAAAASASSWQDADVNLRAAIPYVGKDPAVSGNLYFYLGLSDYNLAKLTGDRTKMQEAQKYSEQSAAMAGPMQQQAARNAQVMKQELAAPVVRR